MMRQYFYLQQKITKMQSFDNKYYLDYKLIRKVKTILRTVFILKNYLQD